MRMLCCLILLFAAALGSHRASAAQDEQPCTAATAVDAGIEAIHADEATWLNRCVRLNGLFVGGAWNAGMLLTDREALMEPRGFFGEDMRRAIVLLPRNRRAVADRPMQVEIVGIVRSCRAANDMVAADQAANPDRILMIGGYCHTSLATYIDVTSTHVISRAPVLRLTEADVPPDRRALVPASPDLPGYGEHVAATRAMIHAIATGDASAFVRLREPEPASKDDLWLREKQRDARREFAGLSAFRSVAAVADRAGDSRMRVFAGSDAIAQVREDPAYRPPLLACWCKTADCAGRWPVTAFDAGNAPERPYLCVSVNSWIDERPGGGTRVEADFPAGSGGFAEPDWPRRPSG